MAAGGAGRAVERPTARQPLPVAPGRAQALQERVLALAGRAEPPREPEPDTGQRNLGDGSGEQAMALVSSQLGGVILSDELRRDVTDAKGITTQWWVDARTGEMRPVA